MHVVRNIFTYRSPIASQTSQPSKGPSSQPTAHPTYCTKDYLSLTCITQICNSSNVVATPTLYPSLKPFNSPIKNTTNSPSLMKNPTNSPSLVKNPTNTPSFNSNVNKSATQNSLCAGNQQNTVNLIVTGVVGVILGALVGMALGVYYFKKVVTQGSDGFWKRREVSSPINNSATEDVLSTSAMNDADMLTRNEVLDYSSYRRHSNSDFSTSIEDGRVVEETINPSVQNRKSMNPLTFMNKIERSLNMQRDSSPGSIDSLYNETTDMDPYLSSNPGSPTDALDINMNSNPLVKSRFKPYSRSLKPPPLATTSPEDGTVI